MYVEERINLGSNIYYVRIEVEYKFKEFKGQLYHNLCLKNWKDDYWDGGDFDILREYIEKNYTEDNLKKYNNNIYFMRDAMYLYDNIPFLVGIRDVYINKNDNLPYSIGYTTKEEIEKYAKECNIKLDFNTKWR